MSSPTRWNLGDPADAVLLLAAGAEELDEAGQQQLLVSDVIPTELHGCTEEDLAAAGVELGDVVEGDPLFRRAVLPAGWTRRAGADARTSYLVDQLGRDRALIFYKAVPYDRRADMVLLPVVEGRPT